MRYLSRYQRTAGKEKSVYTIVVTQHFKWKNKPNILQRTYYRILLVHCFGMSKNYPLVYFGAYIQGKQSCTDMFRRYSKPVSNGNSWDVPWFIKICSSVVIKRGKWARDLVTGLWWCQRNNRNQKMRWFRMYFMIVLSNLLIDLLVLKIFAKTMYLNV